MKALKKLISMFTASAILAVGSIGVLPEEGIGGFVFTVRAADIVASGECGAEGANLTWTLDSEGTLTISGEGEMVDYWTSTGYPWDDYLSDIRNLVIKDGVTSIGEAAFSNCEALTSITIPDSVTSIGLEAFCETPWLQAKQNETPLVIVNGILIDGSTCEGDAIIPNSVTTIGDRAFYGCFEQLTSVIIPDSVTTIGVSAFVECYALTSITIPGSVTSIGELAFSECLALTSITIPDSVTTIGDFAFSFCNSLTSITIENPECKIHDSEDTISSTATIYGYAGSTAEAYAEKYDRKFVALEEKTTTTTSTTTSTTTTTTFTETTMTTSSPSLYKTGDINSDGIVGIGDAVLLCRIVSEDGTLVAPTDVNLDVNTDGIVNIQDAIRILQLLCPNSITVSKTSAQSGDTVTVEVKLHGYHPSAGGVIYIEYDPLLTPTAIRWNEELDGFHVQSAADCYPAYFCWTTKDGKNQTIPNGTVLAYIDFEVSEYATDGKTLEITPCSSALSDENGREITLSTGSGFIAVAQK